jgi:hypothetical protein
VHSLANPETKIDHPAGLFRLIWMVSTVGWKEIVPKRFVLTGLESSSGGLTAIDCYSET